MFEMCIHFIANLIFIEKHIDDDPEMIKDYIKMLKDLYESVLKYL